jgi:hypothetical protein
MEGWVCVFLEGGNAAFREFGSGEYAELRPFVREVFSHLLNFPESFFSMIAGATGVSPRLRSSSRPGIDHQSLL